MTRLIAIYIFILGAVIAFLVWMAPANAQQQMCGAYDEVVANITGPKYGEVPIFGGTVGTQDPGPLMLTFANPTTRTWTTIMVPKPGVACMVFGGSGFGAAKIPTPKPKGQLL